MRCPKCERVDSSANMIQNPNGDPEWLCLMCAIGKCWASCTVCGKKVGGGVPAIVKFNGAKADRITCVPCNRDYAKTLDD